MIIIIIGIVKNLNYRIDINGGVKSPEKRNPQRRIVPDSYDIMAIKTIVRNSYLNGFMPNIMDVYNEVQNDNNISIHRCHLSTFRRIMKRLGYKMVDSKKLGRKVLMERADIVRSRRHYLKESKRIKEKFPDSQWFYLDETYVHKNLIRRKALVSQNELPPKKIDINPGERFIILHVGSKNGFLKNCELVFRGKRVNDDYHKEMNSAVFEDWVQNKLLKYLPPKSVIVMDNASYHSRISNKVPNNSWRKNEIIQWLENNGETIETDCLKIDLLEKVRKLDIKKKYFVDELLRAKGHIVLRLPAYHCDLNAIEKIWAEMKKYIEKNNTCHSIQFIENLIHQSFNDLSPELWRKCIEHSDKVGDEYWNSDNMVDTMIDELIIDFDSESDTESDSSDEDVDLDGDHNYSRQ